MTRQQIREALWFYVNEPVISLPCRVKFSEEDPQLEIKRARSGSGCGRRSEHALDHSSFVGRFCVTLRASTLGGGWTASRPSRL